MILDRKRLHCKATEKTKEQNHQPEAFSGMVPQKVLMRQTVDEEGWRSRTQIHRSCIIVTFTESQQQQHRHTN
jgi:hypothetical protein